MSRGTRRRPIPSALGRLLALCLGLSASLAFAQTASPWLRDPAISPDGGKIAFRYRGQIWIAPVAGGDASPLTPAGFHAATPIWSPSGDMIAFAADKFGPMNVFVAPTTGGEAKRLTWGGADERPSGFTPDGKAVLFASRRLGDATRTFAIPSRFEQGDQLYQAPLADGRETLVLANAAYDARWDRDGKKMLYTSASIEQRFRRGQTSSAARHVWLYDAASGRHERLTNAAAENRDAVWSASGEVYYLSEASGSMNVWKLSLADRKPVQVTHFTGDPVRSLSISSDDDLAFSWNGELYRLRKGAGAPERIAVRFTQTAFVGEEPSRTSAIDDFALSPNGKEIALVSRGDIFVGSMNGKYVKRVTRTPGEERSPSFSPDGRKLAYAGERDGHWSLFESRLSSPDEAAFSEATRLEESALKSGDVDAMLPIYAPDGKHLAYIANRESVRVLALDGKSDVEILPKGRNYSYDDGSWWLSWSPDSKWLALPVQPSGFIGNVAVAPADGAKPARRVAPSGDDQEFAIWGPDGAFLMWYAFADALRLASGDVWRGEAEAVFASRKARDVFEAKLREPVVDDAKPPEIPAGEVGGSADGAEKAAKPKPREIFSFDLEGVEDRKIALTQGPSKLEFVGLLADGVSVLQVESAPNAAGNGLQVSGTVRDLRREAKRTLFSGLPFQRRSNVRMSKDQKKLYFIARGGDGPSDGITEVDLVKGTNRLIKFSLDVSQDGAQARAAAFAQDWMLTKKKFYDPAFTGVDWDAARTKYERFLPTVADARDLAELLSEMSGELKASHTGGNFRARVPRDEQPASLGLYYDEGYAGPGMKVAEIIAGGPFDKASTSLKPGDILKQIDGEDIPLAGGVARALRGRAGELTALTIAHADGTSTTEKIVPVSPERETLLARKRWEKRKRELATAKSCGHVGYVYVEAMDAHSFRDVFSDIFGRFGDVDALVVDIRYNGGGNLHNHLLTLLSGTPYLNWTPPRGGPDQAEPRDRWTKPTAVIMNAASYSDASVFPHAYRDLKLGPLIGDSVAGTGTAVWWAESALIPGLVYGVPQLPLRQMNGKLFENDEVAPDISVPSDATAWDKGEDPQLDAAIKALMPKGVDCPAAPR